MIQTGDCIAWLGSGLSLAAGYPGWDSAVKTLCNQCGVAPPSAPGLVEDELLDKAEECKSANENVYRATLGQLFGEQPTSSRVAYNYLMNLPFKAYVTTNYDPLLSTAGVNQGKHQIYSYPSLPVQKLGTESPIYYIHGLARIDDKPTGENLILARSDFDQAYNGIVRSFLDQILTYNPVLFVGCSLAEPTMQPVFRTVNQIQGLIQAKYPDELLPQRRILLPRRYRNESDDPGQPILVVDDRGESSEVSRLRELSIKVHRYIQTGKNHPEIESILEILCGYEEPNRLGIPSSGLPMEPQS